MPEVSPSYTGPKVGKGSKPESAKGTIQNRLRRESVGRPVAAGGQTLAPSSLGARVGERQHLDQSPARKRLDVTLATGAA